MKISIFLLTMAIISCVDPPAAIRRAPVLPFTEQKDKAAGEAGRVQLPAQQFSEMAEIGFEGRAQGEFFIAPYGAREELLFSLRNTEQIKYLSLGRTSIRSYEFLKQFPALELLVMPMTGIMMDEEREAFYDLVKETYKKNVKDKFPVVIYSFMFMDFREHHSVPAVFRNLHASCEFFRMYGYYRGVINFEGLMRQRRKNQFPVFEANLSQPTLISINFCE